MTTKMSVTNSHSRSHTSTATIRCAWKAFQSGDATVAAAALASPRRTVSTRCITAGPKARDATLRAPSTTEATAMAAGSTRPMMVTREMMGSMYDGMIMMVACACAVADGDAAADRYAPSAASRIATVKTASATGYANTRSSSLVATGSSRYLTISSTSGVVMHTTANTQFSSHTRMHAPTTRSAGRDRSSRQSRMPVCSNAAKTVSVCRLVHTTTPQTPA
mmetsp:Transcript_17702/g.62341  ORF Transcript_17702/g.62341 Transcript_17702/m.62341 type:complete len:221 (-) Transcript_17702:551-1213(-)